MHADDLLPERVLLGDEPARRALVERIARPAARQPGSLLDTGSAFLDDRWLSRPPPGCCSSTPTRSATGWAGSASSTGYDLTHPRDAHAVRLALGLGHLARPDRLRWRDAALEA